MWNVKALKGKAVASLKGVLMFNMFEIFLLSSKELAMIAAAKPNLTRI